VGVKVHNKDDQISAQIQEIVSEGAQTVSYRRATIKVLYVEVITFFVEFKVDQSVPTHLPATAFEICAFHEATQTLKQQHTEAVKYAFK
jgi:hypothetical protein